MASNGPNRQEPPKRATLEDFIPQRTRTLLAQAAGILNVVRALSPDMIYPDIVDAYRMARDLYNHLRENIEQDPLQFQQPNNPNPFNDALQDIIDSTLPLFVAALEISIVDRSNRVPEDEHDNIPQPLANALEFVNSFDPNNDFDFNYIHRFLNTHITQSIRADQPFDRAMFNHFLGAIEGNRADIEALDTIRGVAQPTLPPQPTEMDGSQADEVNKKETYHQK